MNQHFAVPLANQNALVIRAVELKHDDAMRNMAAHKLNHLLMIYPNDIYAEVICEVDDFRLAVKIAFALNQEDERWTEI